MSPSGYLDIAMSASACIVMNPTVLDLSKRNIMLEVSGEGAKMRLSKRRLDNLGSIKSHSGLMNNPALLAALENQLQLGQSFASLSEHERVEAMRKKEGTKHELLNIAPLAKDNLAKKNGDVSKITKNMFSSPSLLRDRIG